MLLKMFTINYEWLLNQWYLPLYLTLKILNMGIQIFLWHSDFTSFWYISKSEFAGSFGSSSSTDEWIKKMWHLPTHTHKYYSVIKKKKKKGNSVIWDRRKSERERQILYDFTYMWNPKKLQLIEKKIRFVVTRGGE